MRFAEAVGEARAGGRPRALSLDAPALAALAPVLAARLYERLLAERTARRRGLGAWYTPLGLARRLVEDAAPEGDTVDPACGGGVFLVAAAEALAGRVGSREAARRLFAVDRDPGALRVARAVLAVSGFDVPAASFVHADALRAPWPRPRFDAVVGNPPFVNIVRLPDDERRALMARYRTFRNKCDLYGLFVEAAFEHLAPGGRLAFVLSDSFLGASSFAPLRRLLFGGEGLAARSVDRVTGRAFDAAVRPLLVTAERRPLVEGATVRFGRVSAGGALEAAAAIDARLPSARAATSAAVPDDPERLARAERMAEGCVPLGALVDLSLGVKTGDDARFVSEAPLGPSSVPCVRGRSVSRWRARTSGHLDYRPEALRAVHGARPRRRASFDRPLKILLRETSGGALVAAMDEGRTFPLDTVHVLHEKAGPKACSLWYVLAVLNAACTSEWYGLHHPGPHVKAAEVRALPVPPPPPADADALALAVTDALLWMRPGDASRPVPETCLAPGARHGLLDLLARRLHRAAGEDAKAQQLTDAVVAAAYGLDEESSPHARPA